MTDQEGGIEDRRLVVSVEEMRALLRIRAKAEEVLERPVSLAEVVYSIIEREDRSYAWEWDADPIVKGGRGIFDPKYGRVRDSE